jgi:hypothetical protein
VVGGPEGMEDGRAADRRRLLELAEGSDAAGSALTELVARRWGQQEWVGAEGR